MARSMAVVPAIMEGMMKRAEKRPGRKRAKLSGNSNTTARNPNERKPRSLMKVPRTESATTTARQSIPTMESRVWVRIEN